MRRILFFIICFFPLLALTQDAEENQAQESAQTSEQQAENSEKPANEFETPDTFEATEKISEDVPIAFPVDI